MLQTLELANIRSYENGLFEFADGVNIIVGPNASGKTNLLEAIYMVCRGTAFKSSDESMLRHGVDWARIDASLDTHPFVIKIKRLPFVQKQFVIDGVEKKRLSETQQLPVVLFEPFDMLLLGGEPERRRNYIDTVLQQVDLHHSKLLKDYKRTLAQRNKLLKTEQLQPEHLFVWDVRLSELGGRLAESRAKYVDYIAHTLNESYRSVSGGNEQLDISYESKLHVDNYAGSMLDKLKKEYTLDRARGFTGAGPHRDDMQILIDQQDVRVSASRGETRSVVLAMKMAELSVLEQRTGKRPLLLLDDVFSELDGKRRRKLAEKLQNYQTFITTTDADVIIENFSQNCTIIPL